MAIALLRRCPLLRALSEKHLRQLLRFSKTLNIAAGCHVFNKKDMAQHMFIVESGLVKIFIASTAKKKKTFAYLGPGAFFGEMALLDAQVRSASAEAVEHSRLIAVHKRDFKRLLQSDPDLSYQMLRTLSERLRKANEQIENLLFQNILGRVANTLCDLAKRNGKKFRGGVLIENFPTRQDLADLVGTTREPLSRALASLQRAELIRFQDGSIHLVEPNRLQALAAQ